MTKLRLSLWLRPDDPACSFYRDQIRRLSDRESNTSGPFEPHVTLVGSILCDESQLQQLIQHLEDKLQGFGSVYCQLEPRPYFAPVWHQAAVLVVKESHELDRLVSFCQETVEPYSEGAISVYPPPVARPHLSLYYGTTNVPTEDEIEVAPDSLTASCVELWSTNPSTAEGVRGWKMVHSISLT